MSRPSPNPGLTLRDTTGVAGAYVLRAGIHRDGRGGFCRLWCETDFANLGIEFRPVQVSISDNTAAATLRGMHCQVEPHGEQKLVTCVAGAVYDVVADLRPDSPSYRTWFGVELRAGSGVSLYVPRGVAHGFITLEPQTRVLYQISTAFEPAAARAVRYNDPELGINWPLAPMVISPRDREAPLLADFNNR